MMGTNTLTTVPVTPKTLEVGLYSHTDSHHVNVNVVYGITSSTSPTRRSSSLFISAVNLFSRMAERPYLGHAT